MSTKFHVGDRVIAKAPWCGIDITGKAGTIMCTDVDGSYGVEFDDYFDGMHGLSGTCKQHHGWWCAEFILAPADLYGDFELHNDISMLL